VHLFQTEETDGADIGPTMSRIEDDCLDTLRAVLKGLKHRRHHQPRIDDCHPHLVVHFDQ